MSTSVEIALGSESELAELTSFDPSSGLELSDWIGHALNQTLQRDMLFGSWADVWNDGPTYSVKISSPYGDVSAYRRTLPAFLNAGRLAWSIYAQHQAVIERNQLKFLLPFGLALAEIRSVQLLHFPPLEALTYMDYIYSPTNRRWENLLACNGYDGSRNTLVERITDVVPLAAPGGDSTGIAPFNETFVPYGKQMLAGILDPSAGATQPIVAYGEPVREWLGKAYSDQVKEPLDVLSLVTLQIVERGPKTPVLCANHPSEFLYYESMTPQERTEMMLQDLIAAGWQSRMCAHWEADPAAILDEVQRNWRDRPDDVQRIIKQQEEEFGYSH